MHRFSISIASLLVLSSSGSYSETKYQVESSPDMMQIPDSDTTEQTQLVCHGTAQASSTMEHHYSLSTSSTTEHHYSLSTYEMQQPSTYADIIHCTPQNTSYLQSYG